MEVKSLIETHLRAIVEKNAKYGNVGFHCNGRGGGGNRRGAGNTRSIGPSLVSRLVVELKITREDVFCDVGVGCGSVAIQIALLTGAVVIGLDNNPLCIEIARLLWDAVSAAWQVRYPSDRIGSCKFGIFDALDFFKTRTDQMWARDAADDWGLWPMPTKIWMADLLFGQLSQHIAFELERPENIGIEAVAALSILWPLKRPTRFPAFPTRWTFITDLGMLEWHEAAQLPVFIFSENSTRGIPQTAVAEAKRPSEPATAAKEYRTVNERRREEGKCAKGTESDSDSETAPPSFQPSLPRDNVPQTCPETHVNSKSDKFEKLVKFLKGFSFTNKAELEAMPDGTFKRYYNVIQTSGKVKGGLKEAWEITLSKELVVSLRWLGKLVN